MHGYDFELSDLEKERSILFGEAPQHSPEALTTLLDNLGTSEDEEAYLAAFLYCVEGHKEEAALNLVK